MLGHNPVLAQWKKGLQELKTKSSLMIKKLTDVAEEHYSEAGDMVIVWDGEVRSCGPERWGPLFSVVDSILKRIGGDYRAEFQKRLPDTFSYVIQRAEEKDRDFLFRMVEMSWKRHKLLEKEIIDKLEEKGKTRNEGKSAPARNQKESQSAPSVGNLVTPEQRRRVLVILQKLVTGKCSPEERSEITRYNAKISTSTTYP